MLLTMHIAFQLSGSNDFFNHISLYIFALLLSTWALYSSHRKN